MSSKRKCDDAFGQDAYNLNLMVKKTRIYKDEFKRPSIDDVKSEAVPMQVDNFTIWDQEGQRWLNSKYRGGFLYQYKSKQVPDLVFIGYGLLPWWEPSLDHWLTQIGEKIAARYKQDVTTKKKCEWHKVYKKGGQVTRVAEGIYHDLPLDMEKRIEILEKKANEMIKTLGGQIMNVTNVGSKTNKNLLETNNERAESKSSGNYGTKARPFKCTWNGCEKTFIQAGHRSVHIRSIHKNLKPHRCTICKARFPTKQRLTQHANSVHLHIKRFHCEICLFTFRDKGHLNTHISAVHDKARPFPCNICKSTFFLRKDHDSHIRAVHLKETPFKCDKCESVFARKQALDNHVQFVHLKARPIVCNLCDRRFTTVQQQDRHVRGVHLNEKPFKCTQCPQKFSQLGNCNQHIKFVHSKERPFPCDHCSLLCQSRQQKDLHNRSVHLHEKPFTCDQCGTAFATKRDCNNHYRFVHLKERPYSCDFCTVQFTSEWARNQHIRAIHMGIKSFTCSFEGCISTFSRRQHADSHYWNMHTKEGGARRKTSEDMLYALFQAAQLKMQRNCRVNLKTIGGIYVELDFADEEKMTHIVIAENDEYDHRDYARPKEFDRMNWIKQSEWHKRHVGKRIIIYRFNPHCYKVDAVEGEITYEEGVEWMINDMKTYVPKLDIELCYVRYPARTHDDGQVLPRVLDEEEFPENLKRGIRYFG